MMGLRHKLLRCEGKVRKLTLLLAGQPPSDLTFELSTLPEVMRLVIEHHYAHRRTADPMFVFAWKDEGHIVATAVFASPANKYFGKGAIELVRLVRVPELTVPLSTFVAQCIRWLKSNTDLKYILSYADSGAGHCGFIYQATNFIYVRRTKGNVQYHKEGRIVSGRSFDQHSKENKAGWERVRTAGKFLYVMPLRERRRALLERFGWVSLPYPKVLT